MDTRPHKHPRSNSSSSGEDRAPKRPAYSKSSTAVIHHDYADYSVAIVCALDFEMSAVRWMLDRQHRPLPEKRGDRNLYVLGELIGHNVVIACLPGTQGKSAAAHVAADLERTFPRIQYRLLVGIGGGVPSDKHDIRLGDVVVSMPDGQYGGVVQYDLGKDTEDGFNLKGTLLPPPKVLTNAVGLMKSDHYAKPNRITEFISEMTRRERRLSGFYQQPSADSDILFRPGFQHTLDPDTCAQSSQQETIRRNPRSSSDPKVHYGLIASGDRVLKSAHKRDSIRDRIGDILCFEMEACGLVTELPYIVIRGISDYADSYKNDQWQPYAAAVAAGCAKELLSYLHVHTTLANSSFDSEKDITLAQRSIGGAVKFTEEQKQKLLESLDFDQFNARQKTIKLAHKRTCRWLLGREEYKNWLDVTKFKVHHGFLWIKGKPGAGKSTIMNFAHIEAKRKMKDKTVISFFFNARGTDLEKSTIGMYRSLLLQLLQKFPEFQEVLLGCLETLGMNIGTSVEYLQFTIGSLKYMFREAIHSLNSRSLVCFIDALDECSEEEVRDMVSFLQEVDEYGENVDESLHFQVCFSSRHYPHISIDRGLSLVLEGQEEHNKDIADYVSDKLKIGNSKAAQDIRELLQEKASGVFMWVVLVVEILNKEYDRGRIMGLRNRLRDIPSDLHELFRDIIRRDSNEGGKDVLLLCIQWILFARQPLTPEQFYFAMHSGIAPESLCEWDTEEITQDVIRRFILDTSKGLAETTRSKSPTVQFIHESVVDFLLKKDGITEIWDDIGANFRGLGHERLKSCCFTYIKLIEYLPPKNKLPAASSKEAKTLREFFIQAFPLIKYAISNVFYHSDYAEGTGIAQGQFLETFCTSKWSLLNNTLERHQIRRHNQSVSLLYLLAELNAPNLIKAHPSIMSYFAAEEERYGTPLFAALAMGNEEVVLAFLGTHAAQRPSNKRLGELYAFLCQGDLELPNLPRDFHYSKYKGILFHLVELDNDTLFQFAMDIYPGMLDNNFYQEQGPVSYAIRDGRIDILRLLFQYYQSKINVSTEIAFMSKNGYEEAIERLLQSSNANTRDPSGHTVLSYAAIAGHWAMATMLVETYEADASILDGNGRTPLLYAAENGSLDMMALLIERTDVNIADKSGRTALSYAVQNCKVLSATVKRLLEKTDHNIEDCYGRAPLSYAAEVGNVDAVRKLLQKTNPNVKDHRGQTPLFYAVRRGNNATVQLLIQKADVDIRDENGRTPLSYAAERGSVSTVTLLLEKADPRIKDHQRRTPLSYAAESGFESIVRLLLEKATINVKDHQGLTPLSYAAREGYCSILKLMLEQDQIDSDTYVTAMSHAIVGRRGPIVNMLLERAETDICQHEKYGDTLLLNATKRKYDAIFGQINSEFNKGKYDRSLLSLAAESGHETIVKILLEKSETNPNSQDITGQTALSYATHVGHETIVKLLLGAHEINPNLYDKLGLTTLSLAIMCERTAVIKLLIEDDRVDLNIQNSDDQTPLLQVVARNDISTVGLMLATGRVDVNLRDHGGQTPFSFAAERGYKEIGRLLWASNKVDPNIVKKYPSFYSLIRRRL